MEAAVLIGTIIVQMLVRMPGINRGDAICSSPLAGILRHFNENSSGIKRARSDLLNRIAHAVANVVRSMFVAGVGGFSHQDAKVLRGNGPVRKLQRDRAALSLLHDA